MKILMVCLGNICRSPMAEGILKDKVRKKGLDWQVDSVSIDNWHTGETPDKRAITIMAQNGIDISDQVARQITKEDLESYDMIYTMDEENYTNAMALANKEAQQEKIDMILNVIYPDNFESVPDPYWNDDGFAEVYELLNEACEQIIQKELASSKS